MSAEGIQIPTLNTWTHLHLSSMVCDGGITCLSRPVMVYGVLYHGLSGEEGYKFLP